VGTALERPRRQTSAQRRAARHIRVDVGGNVEPACSRSSNPVEDLGHATPILFVGRLEMPDLHGYMRPSRDLKDLTQRFIQRIGFAALMSRVDAAVLVSDFSQLDNLIRFGKTRRNVLQRSRKTKCAT